jgi:cell division protein FtsI/penicillin-binding protein 2
LEKVAWKKVMKILLRGQKGYKNIVIDRFGRDVGPTQYDGSEDIAPVAGKNLTLTIDIELQTYAEQLMANKRGALVAIEPSTGEILAISKHAFIRPKYVGWKCQNKKLCKTGIKQRKSIE